MEPWVLDEGIKLAQAITPEASKAGFQVTLGGSVLLKGRSDKDIDLFFLPKTKSSKPSELVMVLTKLWGSPTKIDLKFEDRSRRVLEDEQDYLNTRFNPERVGNAVRGGASAAGRVPSFTRRTETYRGMAIEESYPNDLLLAEGELGLNSLPPDYRYVRRDGGTGPIAIIRSNWRAAGGSLSSLSMDPETFDTFLGDNPFSDGTPTQAAAAPPDSKQETKREPFRAALMFMRGKDRIDAFIV